MKDLYKEHLFAKHILVNDKGADDDSFYALFTLARKLAIEVTKGQELAHISIVKFASDMLGIHVPEPFYKGFPDTVRRLSANQLLFDQLFHYYKTYGKGILDEAGHSIMEAEFRKHAFREKVEPRSFIIVDENEAKEILIKSIYDLLASSRPLNKLQYLLVKEALSDFQLDISKIGSINTLVQLYYDTKDDKLLSLFKLSDVIKLVDYINFFQYGNKRLYKLNLKNTDRKLITKVIRATFQNGNTNIRACYEKKATWCGLLHHIHYKPTTKAEEDFLVAMRTKGNESVYSEFELLMAVGDICDAIDYLKKYKGSGAVMRNLDYIASRCKTKDELYHLLDSINTNNIIMCIQLLNHYYFYTKGKRTFKFTSHYLVKTHDETGKEMKKRRSALSKETCEAIASVVLEKLCKICHGKLGKVYIDEGMKKMALPLQETASSGGFGVLPKGSRIPLDMSKVLRVFTYWSKVDDVDLSCIGIMPDGRTKEFSWRTMSYNQKHHITFSGDQTAGYNGGSEYFDIDVKEFKKCLPNIKQLVFCNNVYSFENFSKLNCRAGYMVRNEVLSGEVFEPKTVKSAFNITCDSTFAYMFAIDFHSEELVWLNLGRDSQAIVAGTTPFAWLLPYIFATKVINVYDFFEMLATEVVSTPEEADIIVSDKDFELPEGKEQIHSYDFERILALMNS